MIALFHTWVSFSDSFWIHLWILSILSNILEVFIEAVIQLHLSFLLIGLLATIDYVQEDNNLGLLGDNKWLIWLSFCISVLSATFGLTKFLKSGPFKILNEGPHAVGIGITLLIISSFMISKAVWVILNTVYIPEGGERNLPNGKHSQFNLQKAYLCILHFT